MIAPGSEIVAFNLDRTLIDDPLADLIQAAGTLGLGPVIETPLPPQEMRQRFVEWIAGQTCSQVEPVLNYIVDHGEKSIAPWGLEAMSNLSRTGHALILWSRVMPHETVDAHRQSIQAFHPDINIEVVRGSALELERKHYTGTVFPLLKAEVLERLQKEGHHIKLVADSFASAYPAMNKASYMWAVNPDERITRYHEYADMHSVEWWTNNPDITVVRSPGLEKVRYFNMAFKGQRRLFRKFVKTDMLR